MQHYSDGVDKFTSCAQKREIEYCVKSLESILSSIMAPTFAWTFWSTDISINSSFLPTESNTGKAAGASSKMCARAPSFTLGASWMNGTRTARARPRYLQMHYKLINIDNIHVPRISFSQFINSKGVGCNQWLKWLRWVAISAPPKALINICFRTAFSRSVLKLYACARHFVRVRTCASEQHWLTINIVRRLGSQIGQHMVGSVCLSVC